MTYSNNSIDAKKLKFYFYVIKLMTFDTLINVHFKYSFCLFCPDEGKCVPQNV